MINENMQHEMFLDRQLTNNVPVLPPQLTFNSEKITSITPYIKEIKYSPNTGMVYQNNQTIKFLMNSTGFIDPYGTYFSFDIENKSDRPLQFDNSAHSLISSLVISSNGNVIEEITDYDVICSAIFDTTLNSDMRKQYKDVCFGSGNSSNGSEGTNEPILYNQGLTNPDNINNKIKLLWNDALFRDPRAFVEGLTCQVVNNGIIKRWMPQTSIRITLPLMSNIFGFGLSLQNYKWIPLEMFPNLEFSITLNPYAMFAVVPDDIKSMGAYDNFKSAALSTFVLDELDNSSSYVIFDRMRSLISVNENRRTYELKNTHLVTTQLFFDSSILNIIRDLALKNGFVLETQLFQSFQQKYFSQSPDNTYVLNVPRKSIRTLTTLFLNRNYEKYNICRKLKRYSRGITKMHVKIGEDYYPHNPIEGNASNNYGTTNNDQFLKNWSKAFYKTNQNFGDSIITNFNYAIDHYFQDEICTYISQNINVVDDSSNISGRDFRNLLLKPFNHIKYGNMIFGGNSLGELRMFDTISSDIGYSNEKVGRALFSVSLDQIPMSGNIYKSGIDTRFTKPILIELVQSQNMENFVGNNQFIQYVLLEFDYTIKIGFNGFINKEF